METKIFKRRSWKKLLAGALSFQLIGLMMFGFTSLAFATEAVDLELPSDVENLIAISGDGEISLSWDVATDNVNVEGYKVYYGLESVNEEGGEYIHEIEIGDVIEYTVENLENEVEYFFAITAFDAAGNESESYSYEDSAMPYMPAVEEEAAPVPMGDDGASPTVRLAESYSNVQVRIDFSEAVQLPGDEPQTAFLIQDNLTGDFLPLLDAEILDDEPNAVVIETAAQEVGIEYILTAGITVEDVYGNSIRSGTSDTATFLGGTGDYIPVNVELPEELPEEVTPELIETSDLEETLLEDEEDLMEDLEILTEEMDELMEGLDEMIEEVEAVEGAEPMLIAETEDSSLAEMADALLGDSEESLPEGVDLVEAISETDVQIVFSEVVELLEAETHFIVAEDIEDDPMTEEIEEAGLLAIGAEELMVDGQTVVLTVVGLEPGKDYLLSVMNTVTETGIVIDSGEGIAFQGQLLELADLIPPAEITDLVATIEGKLARLAWTISVSEDAIEQLIYESSEDSAYELRTVLPPLVSELELADLEAGLTYLFKITSKDAAGNESDGVVVEVTLPETGPGLALVFGLSALGTAVVRRRKKLN
ncbi:fibronectin type III domain-containing protein [Candidatus Peregrinibacteria bacterium]|nr:fibronectin type III domain-containing protein [Candidatus Peregrinibacteria bacterium]